MSPASPFILVGFYIRFHSHPFPSLLTGDSRHTLVLLAEGGPTGPRRVYAFGANKEKQLGLDEDHPAYGADARATPALVRCFIADHPVRRPVEKLLGTQLQVFGF